MLLNQGTVATDAGQLLRPGLAGLAAEDLLVVAVTGGGDPALLGPVPTNARVERFVPFDLLLPHVDVMVTNGGFGGVQLALAHGVPLVGAGGVGVDLRTQTPTPQAIQRGRDSGPGRRPVPRRCRPYARRDRRPRTRRRGRAAPGAGGGAEHQGATNSSPKTRFCQCRRIYCCCSGDDSSSGANLSLFVPTSARRRFGSGRRGSRCGSEGSE